MYADIIFPLKLPPLTYKVPENAPSHLKGRIVRAPLIGKSLYGIVFEVKEELQIRQDKIKEIQSIYQYCLSEAHLSLLKWLSDYYLTPVGAALKGSFFEEVVDVAVRGQLLEVNRQPIGSQIMTDESEDWLLRTIYSSIIEKKYKSFLFHAQSTSDEYYLLNKVFSLASSTVCGAIILVPEISFIERLALMLKNFLGERLCVLHSKLSKSKRIEAIKRIISGESDVIVGTRSAIFAPLNKVSFIAVLGEHSPSYKAEEGLRYNARDIAVMRGFIENSCVLLTSVCPSVESIYNVKIGKYAPLGNIQKSKIDHPKIKIIDINNYKHKAFTISPDILKEAKRINSKKGISLFLVNRKGYSLIRCEDCRYIEHCKKCSVPLVFYKGKNIVRCHICGHQKEVQAFCEVCKGFNLKPFGAGVEKIKEELEEFLKEKALLLQKGKASYPLPSDDNVSSFVIGTTYAVKRLKNTKLDAIAIINADSFLSQPDFRAYERAFQDFIQLSEMVKPDGCIYLQTWDPNCKIFKLIKNYDFHNFYEYEMSQRKELNYPPFFKIILLNIFVKRDIKKFLQEIKKIVDKNILGLEVLGPVEILSALKSYKHCIQILIKSKDRRLINNVARHILSELKKFKGIKVNVDVDPLKI